tara:strand:+ start:117 stop:1019 length:903 start_codon:yes stop_codon:yes gene_type:complete
MDKKSKEEDLDKYRDHLRSEFSDHYELERLIDDQNDEEVLHANALINNKYITHDFFASAEWINDWMARIESPSTTPTLLSFLIDQNINEETPLFRPKSIETAHISHPSMQLEAIEQLKSDWNKIPQEDFQSHISATLPNTNYTNTAEMFVGELNSGRIPPLEVLVSIAKCFSLYFEAEGDLNLESVFFGKPIKKKGNYARRRYRDSLFANFHDLYKRDTRLRESLNNNDKNHYKLAMEEFSANFLLNTDISNALTDKDINEASEDWDKVDTFLRGYRRWKEKNQVHIDNNKKYLSKIGII